MKLDLSDKQRATVAAAITILGAFVIVLAVAAVLWVVGTFVRSFSNVLLPLAVAGVAALVFRPYFEWLHERCRLSRPMAVTVVFLSAILPLVAFGWFLGDVIVNEVAEIADDLPKWWAKMVDDVQARWPKVVAFFELNPLGQQIKAAAGDNGGAVVGAASMLFGRIYAAGLDIVRGIFGLFGWVVLPVYFAFFLMADEPDRIDRLDNYLPFLKASTRQDVVYLVKEFVNIIVAFFRGQMIIAFMQGLLFAIGFSIVGLKYGFVIGLVLGLLNVVPYLGSILGLGVALPLALMQSGGGMFKVLMVITVFTIVQMIEGYILTPKIMGDRTGLHPMVIIVAIFFWGSALGGIMGMILAIPLTAFLVVFWRLAKEKYMHELV